MALGAWDGGPSPWGEDEDDGEDAGDGDGGEGVDSG